jgi:hypothetical protein
MAEFEDEIEAGFSHDPGRHPLQRSLFIIPHSIFRIRKWNTTGYSLYDREEKYDIDCNVCLIKHAPRVGRKGKC